MFRPFPSVVESNSQALKSVETAESSLRSAEISDLQSAVDSLPELLKDKAALERHTQLLTAVMSNLETRKTPTLYDLQTRAMSGAAVGERLSADVEECLKTLTVKSDGVRLILSIGPRASAADVDRWLAALDPGDDIKGKVGRYLSGLRALRLPAEPPKQESDDLMSAVAASALRVGKEAVSRVGEKLKVKRAGQRPLTRDVRALLAGEGEGWKCLDPKLRSSGGGTAVKATPKGGRVVVFVVGGGSKGEAADLDAGLEGWRVFYGGTEAGAGGVEDLLEGV